MISLCFFGFRDLTYGFGLRVLGFGLGFGLSALGFGFGFRVSGFGLGLGFWDLA